jgi:hypothetical protein
LLHKSKHGPRDLTPVASLSRSSVVFHVHASLPNFTPNVFQNFEYISIGSILSERFYAMYATEENARQPQRRDCTSKKTRSRFED